MVVFIVKSNENTYLKGRALMQMYRVVPITKRGNSESRWTKSHVINTHTGVLIGPNILCWYTIGQFTIPRWDIGLLCHCNDTEPPGLSFIITDLPSVFVLIITDLILNDSLCCSYTFSWCFCRFKGLTVRSAFITPNKVDRKKYIYAFAWNMFDWT